MWTGRELFYWGGGADYETTHHADGALYDPSADEWRRIPSSPLEGRSSAGAVWTGKQVFVWGGWARRRDWSDGALFDPGSGKWRTLPPSPLTPRAPVATVWTGSEVIVWGDTSRSRGPEQREGAAYGPEGDRWRKLPRAPFGLNLAEAVWTGKEMIVFGALLDGRNWSESPHARGIAYDPDADSWRVIADYPLSPQASSAAWTGRELLAWDYELAAGAYDPAGDSWRKVPRLPLRFFECYPESARLRGAVVAWFCGQGVNYDIATSSWRRMTPAPTENIGGPVSAETFLLFAGAAKDGSANALWAYRP